MLKNKTSPKSANVSDPFQRKRPEEVLMARAEYLHIYGNRIKCATDTKGYPTPRNEDRVRIVVDASEGYIPLWAEQSTLRWRFQTQSLAMFSDPAAAGTGIRALLGEALLAWGDAAPIRFSERKDAWDFEISIRNADDCDTYGCTLAMAFFPDSGRHELVIYPKMFEQSRREQVETLAHELGHVFGLRHFFAKLSEESWPSEIFGTHNAFSIMNYGAKSRLTKYDKADLKNLYRLAWNGTLTEVNGTPIRFVKPYHLA